MKKKISPLAYSNYSFTYKGPFDECRQEMIYKACARALIQIVYSSLLLFLFYLLFGRFIELVLRCHALPLFWTYLRPLI